MKHFRRTIFLGAIGLLTGIVGCPGMEGGAGGCNQQPTGNPPLGDGSRTDPSGEFVVSPKHGASIPARRVTVFGHVPPGTVGVFGNGQPGVVQPDGTYFVHNVELGVGPNELLVVATDNHDHPLASATVTVTGVDGPEPLLLSLSSSQIQTDEQLVATAKSPLSVARLKVDFDDDGVFDVDGTNLIPEHAYATSGEFAVRAVGETSDGLFFSVGGRDEGTAEHRVRVGQSSLGSEMSITEPRSIIGLDDGTAWILAGRSLLLVDATPSTIRTIEIPPGIQAEALAIDSSGRFVLAEPGANRISRLQVDGTVDVAFGAGGSVSILAGGGGQLSLPRDVSTGEDSIFVLDAGNGRIVRLSGSGQFEKAAAVEGEVTSIDCQNGGLYLFDKTNVVRVLQESLRPEKAIDLSINGALAGSQVPGRSEWIACSSFEVLILNAAGRVARRLNSGAADLIDIAAVKPPAGATALALSRAGRLLALPLADEAPGWQPEAVWASFMTRLGTSDIEGALGLVHPRDRERIRLRLEALTDAQRTVLATRLEHIRVAKKGEVFAFYEIHVGASTASVTFLRDSVTRRWFIGSF